MNCLPKTLMLLGSGELGKEFTISAKRLGCKVIACDRYMNAPAMQVSDTSEVLDMNNAKELKNIIYKYKPDLIVPEIEALSVETLLEVEKEGFDVIPNANATSITMNRDKIRNLAHNKLKIRTANFAYASTLNEVNKKSQALKFPFLMKPIMSSSGKGQSLIHSSDEIENAWKYAILGSRGKSRMVILEEFIDFELEITLLSIRKNNGLIIFCPPIGHIQRDGDYQQSWQPANISSQQLEEAKKISKKILDEIGGKGIFGIEFFITKKNVIFSELSPRPHDTGLVTLISQNISEFELHLRAILDLPIPDIILKKPSASNVILSPGEYLNIGYRNRNFLEPWIWMDYYA